MAAKMRVPLANAAKSFSMSAVLYMPNVYISLFRGDASLIGVANILVVGFDIIVLPWMGQMSDAGYFNRYVFRDVESWGRRSPLMLMSIPICMVSCVFFWIGPEKLPGPKAVALWYAVMRFSLAFGFTMFEAAFHSGYTELFPSKTERVNLGVIKFFGGLTLGTVATIGVTPSALGVEEAGSPEQIRLFSFFALLTGASWLFAIPYGILMRRSLMMEVVPRESVSWRSLWALWSESRAFRCLAVASHCFGAGFSLALSGLPFYLEVVLSYTPSQVETAMRMVFAGAFLMIMLMAPAVVYLSRRFDPSYTAIALGLACIFIGVCHAHGEYGLVEFWPQVLQMTFMCGGGIGGLAVSWAGTRDALVNWVVDEDQVRQARKAGILRPGAEVLYSEIPARRDGMITSFRGVFAFSSQAWAGVMQFVIGILGYDGSLVGEGKSQPEAVNTVLRFTFVFILPLIFVLFAVPLMMFPLRGAKLDDLMADYSRLFKRISIRPSQLAHARLSQLQGDEPLEPPSPGSGAVRMDLDDESEEFEDADYDDDDLSEVCIETHGVVQSGYQTHRV